MNDARDILNAVLCACAVTFLVTLWIRHQGASTTPNPRPEAGLRRQAEATPEPRGFIREPGIPGTLPDAGRQAVREYNAELGKAILDSGNPVVQDIEARIAGALSPGWESTFVVHDAMVVTASLTDMARLAMVPANQRRARRSGKDAEGGTHRFLALADDFAIRWLLTKHPGLGGEVVRDIVRSENHEILPVLGPFNLLEVSSIQKALGIPLAATPAPVEFVLPEGIRRMRDAQDGKTQGR